MIIKKNSWHYKLNKKYQNYKMWSMEYHGTSLCEYMQVTLITILNILFKVFVASILIGVIGIMLNLTGMTIIIVGLSDLFGTNSLIAEYTSNINDFEPLLKHTVYTLFGIVFVSTLIGSLYVLLYLIARVLTFIVIILNNCFKKLKIRQKSINDENLSPTSLSIVKTYIKDKHKRVCRKIDFEE